jgi:2-polyprenyl-3-methyl-5-hydroxy-6-metoxy-1,4-benzoquinol methylase
MRKIVYKIEEGDDPAEIYCTTYQMRNFYQQMADGFFSSLDIMNYIQHHRAVLMMEKGDRILDVCCGRGLLLPMIRWYRKDIKEYVGVDISEKNIGEQIRRSGIKSIEGLDYYPFPIIHILCSVEDMDTKLDYGSFDFVIYTSAIEHMQKEVGYKSLENCFNLMKPGAEIFLSCPNTINKKDPYDTQYAAHLYEWDMQELCQALGQIGFSVLETFGIVAKKRDFDKFMENMPDAEKKVYNKLMDYLPTTWLMAIAPILFPQPASEVVIIAQKPTKKVQGFFK